MTEATCGKGREISRSGISATAAPAAGRGEGFGPECRKWQWPCADLWCCAKPIGKRLLGPLTLAPQETGHAHHLRGPVGCARAAQESTADYRADDLDRSPQSEARGGE